MCQIVLVNDMPTTLEIGQIRRWGAPTRCKFAVSLGGPPLTGLRACRSGKFIAIGCVGGGNVEIQRPKSRTAGIANLVLVSAGYEHQRSGLEGIRMAIDDRLTRSILNV